jgi:Mrp family chromosome partitioning ATPase
MINAIVAIGQVEWEAQFVSGLSHPMTGIQVQRRCVDAVDVLSVAKVISADVVVVSDHTMRLDEEFFAELSRLQIRVIALTTNSKYFADFANVEWIELEQNPLAAIPILAALVRVNKASSEEPVPPSGELIFVGGICGGTGKTRLAMELAFSLANKGKRTLLVDGDTYGPAMAQLFNQSVTELGLLDVCRKVERKTATQNFLSQDAVNFSDYLFFLPGLVKASRWVDLRQVALTELWLIAKAQFDYVIVDAGPVLEVDPMVSMEIGLPKRNLVSSTALNAADKIVLTCRSDAVSVTRLIKGAIENWHNFSGKAVSAVVLANQDKKSAKEAVSTIGMHSEITNIQMIRSDFELVYKAQELGTFVAQLPKAQELINQYDQVANAIVQQEFNPVTNSRLRKLFPRKVSAGIT